MTGADIIRIEVPEDPEVYIFSDGQEPPRFIKLWYEGGPDEVPKGFAVSLRGVGPLTQPQISLNLEDHPMLSYIAIAEIVEARQAIEYQAELPLDPRFYGEDVAEQVASDAARHILQLARYNR